jgi:hypothetical protein
MPVIAIPKDIEFRKVTPTQQKSLDRIMGDNKNKLLQAVAIPTIALSTLAIVGGTAFIFREQIKEFVQDNVDDLTGALRNKAKGFVDNTGELLANIVTDIVGRDNPKTPAEFVTAQGEVKIIPRCQRWETDYLDTQVQAQAGGDPGILGLAQFNIIKNMKAEGCDRPVIIKKSQWDEV